LLIPFFGLLIYVVIGCGLDKNPDRMDTQSDSDAFSVAEEVYDCDNVMEVAVANRRYRCGCNPRSESAVALST
jgi:hypothetical protein